MKMTFNISLSKVKELARRVFGDNFTSWIHAIRFIYLINQKQIEYYDMEFAQGMLKIGDVAIDVGANGANWTSILSKSVGSKGKVFAFEADPYYAVVTRKAIKLLRLKNLIYLDYGLSDKTETTWLQVIDIDGKRVNGTGKIVRDSYSHDLDLKCVPVRLEALDNLVKVFPEINNTRLMKIDVEGHELMVLEGAKNVIEKARPLIIVEFTNPKDLLCFFDRINYDSYVVINKNLIRRSRQAGKILEGSRPNSIMIPKEFDFSSKGIICENVFE